MKRILSICAAVCRLLSVAALLCSMLVIGADIASRALFNQPVAGSIDMVTFLFAAILFGALPETFRSRQHIVVDIIDLALSARATKLLSTAGCVLGVAVLCLFAWRLLDPIFYMYEMGDSTLNIELPKWILGAISLFGIVLSTAMELSNLFINRRIPGIAEKSRNDSL